MQGTAMSQQTVTEYRWAGLKAFGTCLLLQLIAGLLALQLQSQSADWYLRLKCLILIPILLLGSTLFGLVGYVRFLDLKRGRVLLKRSN